MKYHQTRENSRHCDQSLAYVFTYLYILGWAARAFVLLCCPLIFSSYSNLFSSHLFPPLLWSCILLSFYIILFISFLFFLFLSFSADLLTHHKIHNLLQKPSQWITATPLGQTLCKIAVRTIILEPVVIIMAICEVNCQVMIMITSANNYF